ncbi:DUF5683 domain-containing protein [Viscerimonas tarda]
MKKGLVLLICLIIFTPHTKGQDTISVYNEQAEQLSLIGDTVTLQTDEKAGFNQEQLKLKNDFKPDPNKAVIYSAIFPGLGQIYNRKYWKLPVIYGGFIGLSYGISWNGRYYDDYSKAYRSIAGEDPRGSYYGGWGNFVPGRDPNELSDSQIDNLKNAFRRKKDFYRRNRDLCIIAVVGVYLVCMVDAYVDAQLFDFDISPDLSLRVEPAVIQPFESFATLPMNKSLGVQCSITF